jgi:Mrp family chromosome partitioning ATPase
LKQKKLLVLISGQKGGVGKSTFARILLDSLRRRGRSVAAFDGDGAVGHLLQYYGERTYGRLAATQNPVFGVDSYDLRDRRDRERLLESLHVNASVLLHDLPAGALSSITEAVDVTGKSAMALVDAARTMGYGTTVVIVINTDKASARAVQTTIEAFGNKARYVVVKNLNGCTLDDFIIYDGFEDATGLRSGGEARHAAEQANAKELVMPEIFRTTAVKIDLWSLRFRDAVADPRMHIQDRTRIGQWMAIMDAEIDKAGKRLGFGA